MGFVKERLIQEEEQGWGFSDNIDICWRCVTNAYLKDFVKDNAEGYSCDFCDRTSRAKPSTVPFDDLMEVIADAVQHRYSDVINEGIIYDHEEDCYAAQTFSTDELFFQIVPWPTANDKVSNHIINSFTDRLWCQRHYGSLTREQKYRLSWQAFCQTVTHEKRYLFEREEPFEYDDGIPVRELLDELGTIVGRHGFIRTLRAGFPFFRVRIHEPEDKPVEAHELGPPPPRDALSNRMSPAGISLFYGALESQTARAETFLGNSKRDGTVSTWTSKRELVVVDFTHQPEPPSFYDTERADERDECLFLASFVSDLIKPVAPDRREHTDYVPTQIVTEYFRHLFRTSNGKSIDGMLYPSSVQKGGTCVSLFFGYESLDPKMAFPRQHPMVVFDQESVRRVRPHRRKTSRP